MILVTGGTGLTGSHLLLHLIQKGHAVKAIKRPSSDVTVLEKIFKYYCPEKAEQYLSKIEWTDGDTTDIFSLREALKGVDKVYHCAAIVSFSKEGRKQMQYVNVEGTANIVNASILEGVKKLVHCSSIATLGKPETGNHTDETLIWKTSPNSSLYSITKFGAEREVWRGIEEGLDAVIVNPSVILGPGDPYKSSTQIYKQVKDGIKFYTKGVTGFVDVRDVVKAMDFLMESDIKNERFILNSENLSFKTLFELFAEQIKVKPPSIYAGKFLCEVAWRLEKTRSLITGKPALITKETVRTANKSSYYSNEKFKEASGFTFIPVKDSVANTCSFFEKFPLPWK